MGTLVLCLAALCHGGEAAHAGAGVHSVCRLVVVRAARQNSAPRLGLSAAVPPGPRLGCTTQQTWNKNFRNSDAAYRGRAAAPGRGKYLLQWVYTHLIHIYISISLEVRISLEVHLLFYTYLLI